MAVKAKAEITLATIRDVQSVTRYYLLQSSTSSIPSKPTANPPGGSWVKTEPSYTSGSTNSLYFTDLTVFSDGTFVYSDVSLSSSYEAAKAAYNKAVSAEGTANSASDKVDNLQVGGRNLILNTLYPDATGSNLKRPHIFGQISNTGGRGTCTVAEHGIRFTCTSENWQYIYFGASANSATPSMLGLEAGETYTLSADLSWKILSSEEGMADTATRYMGAMLFYSTVESGSWSAIDTIDGFPITQAEKGTEMSGRLEYTFTVPLTAKRLYLGIRSGDANANHYAVGDYIEARNLKLEKGNKATGWTPAPEDLDASLSEARSLANAAQNTADTALSEAVEYVVGTQTEVTGTWTGVTREVALTAGKTIAYKLPFAGSGNASLKLALADGSETDLIPVYLNTTRVTTHFGAGSVINMTYDGESWRASSIPNTNTNYYDRRLHNTAIKAAAAVTKAHLIAGTADGYKNFAASLAFDLAYPILYASAAISANTTAKTAYEAMPDVNFSTTGTIESGTAAKILWLKGTVEGNTFTIAESNWLTTVVPTEEDGMYYIPLGVMSSTTVGYFATSDRLYAFVDGAFQPLDNASRKLAEKAREEVVDAEERVRTYAESAVSQKADEIEISISTVTGTLAAGIQDCQESIAQTDEALNDSVDTLTQRISDQEDALLDYKHETSTYFRFNTDGLNIGKQEDGDESPYSINIDNEKMAFLQNGTEIAYVQYNKMHINAIEAMDRLSVGAAADGGYFDFISTEYGMGVKWRAVNQSNGASLNMMRAGLRVMAKRAEEYEAVQDEEGVFKVDFGGEDK